MRYLSNRSSGKMGHAVAAAALRRGATVTLIAGPTPLSPPPGVVYVPVQTAEDMREASLHHLPSATIVIKAAAVADYRVARPSATKIKSKKDEGVTLELVPNPDILKEIAQRKGSRFVVGFAAETDDVRAHAAKLSQVDLLVVNDVSKTGSASTRTTTRSSCSTGGAERSWPGWPSPMWPGHPGPRAGAAGLRRGGVLAERPRPLADSS